MKKFLRNIFNSDDAVSLSKRIAEWVASGVVGSIIGAVVTGNYIWSLVFAGLMLIVTVVYIIVTNRAKNKYDILQILNDEFDEKNYRQVLMMGYPLSRPLHLSGRSFLRYEIGKITTRACECLAPNDVIRINDENTLVSLIKAKTLIDDLGWTAHKMGKTDLACESIQKGIEIAIKEKDYKLVIKGYRHLIGIYDEKNNYSKRDEVEQKARIYLNDDKYKNSFGDENKYKHAVAGFDYAYAKTLIDDRPEEALEIAKKVQEVFLTDDTIDMDRYVKTFDLIGDIYAASNRPDKLKIAKATYLEGIQKCETYGRSERMIRIITDYIQLLLKMLDSNEKLYDEEEWEELDEQELKFYKKAYKLAKRTENKKYLSELNKKHKNYLERRK